VRLSLTRRPIEVDVAVMISFLVVYIAVAKTVAFRIWRKRDYGSLHATLITVYAALLLGDAFVLVGELWCDTMESIRIGNGHMSYRGERAPWGHHHVAEYVAGVVTFCGIVAFQHRAGAPDVHSSNPNQDARGRLG